MNLPPDDLPLPDLLRRLEHERIAALLARDLLRLQQLHAPTYQLVTPTGRTYSRERYLASIDSGALRYLRWEPGEMAVRVSPAMAAVRYEVTLELDGGQGQGTPLRCWHTDLYERFDAGWQAVWSQATAIKP